MKVNAFRLAASSDERKQSITFIVGRFAENVRVIIQDIFLGPLCTMFQLHSLTSYKCRSFLLHNILET